jgi:hypothetical protein
VRRLGSCVRWREPKKKESKGGGSLTLLSPHRPRTPPKKGQSPRAPIMTPFARWRGHRREGESGSVRAC